jgi:hypothetical protein
MVQGAEMAKAVCSNGHDSAARDVCDVCGAHLAGNSGDGQSHAAANHPNARIGVPSCPRCGTPKPRKFCSACGFSFSEPQETFSVPSRSSPSGPPESLSPSLARPEPVSSPWSRPGARPSSSLLEPPEQAEAVDEPELPDLLASLFAPASPASPEPPPTLAAPTPAAPTPAAPTPAAPTPAPPPTAPTPSISPATWMVVVGPDRVYYDTMRAVRGPQDIAFPRHATERRIPLSGKQMRIGRRSATRDFDPEIDTTGPSADGGVSRLHAVLIAAQDGTWAVLDSGSANGTFLNGRKLAAGDLITLRDGDRINLGAWTAITVHRG